MKEGIEIPSFFIVKIFSPYSGTLEHCSSIINLPTVIYMCHIAWHVVHSSRDFRVRSIPSTGRSIHQKVDMVETRDLDYGQRYFHLRAADGMHRFLQPGALTFNGGYRVGLTDPLGISGVRLTIHQPAIS